MAVPGEVVVAVLGHAVGSIVFVGLLFLFGLPMKIKDLARAIEKLAPEVRNLCESVKSIERRIEISDRILSDILSEPVDTDSIAKDGTKYPRIKKKGHGVHEN